MSTLNREKQIGVVSALAEGNSIRSIERMTGIHRDTIMRLGVDIGEKCELLMDCKMRNLECRKIEVDELWGFIGKKKKNTTPKERNEGFGDVWTFTSIDPETKLMPCYLVGKRDKYHACMFMEDLARRMVNRLHLSSDAMQAYPEAVERGFGGDVDYGQIVKEYEVSEETTKFNPLKSVSKMKIMGNPDMDEICTSYIERSNLTIRTHCKRLQRMTLGFSKKLRNFRAAMGLQFAYYNFVKIHSSIRCTPAMAAGVNDRIWTVKDLMESIP